MRVFNFVLLLLVGLALICPQGAFAKTKEKALVVVSFGTTFKQTRELDIKGVEKALMAAFPDREFKRAFTSKIIIKRLWQNDGIKVDDLATVLGQLHKEGYKDIVIQPTHLTPGEEIANKVLPAVELYKGKFEKLALGDPLLTQNKDFELVARALTSSFPVLEKKEIIVFMGHGSPNKPNIAYQKLEDTFKKLDIPAIIGVVEENDHPNYQDMFKNLKNIKTKKVFLLPLMLVAGDHASNDMVGGEDDSWYNLLKKEGYKVRYDVVGIGRNVAIQKIYVAHALSARVYK